MNKKAVSTVVGVTIMVALVVGLTALVWTLITGVVEEELEGATSCVGNFDKIKINNRFTCLNPSANQLNFSITVEDVNVSQIVVSISGEGQVKSLRIDGSNSYAYAKNFADASYGSPLIAPGENEGRTYSIDTSDSDFGISEVETIEIAPVINGQQCDISDSLLSVDDCQVFVS